MSYFEELDNMARKVFGSEFLKSAEDAYNRYREKLADLYGKGNDETEEPGNDYKNQCKCRPFRERVSKEHGDIVVKIPVPGLKRENLDIKVLGRVLTVTAVNIEEDGDGFVKNGYRWTYNVEKNLDLKKVSAKLSDGVLTITVPALKDSKPDEIQINID